MPLPHCERVVSSSVCLFQDAALSKTQTQQVNPPGAANLKVGANPLPFFLAAQVFVKAPREAGMC